MLCRQPIVTGTSVLAIKYKDGIMMAADCLGTKDPFFVSFVWIVGPLPRRTSTAGAEPDSPYWCLW